MPKSKKTKIRDLKPNKDAKGGRGVITVARPSGTNVSGKNPNASGRNLH